MHFSQSEVWKRILETGDIKELEYLLHLVIQDEESIRVILEKFTGFLEEPIEIPIHVQINIKKEEETLAQKQNT